MVLVGEELPQLGASSGCRSSQGRGSGSRPASTAARYSAMTRSTRCSREASAPASSGMVHPRSSSRRAQPPHAALQEPGHRGRGAVEPAADLLEREAFGVAQGQGLPLVLRQARQDPGEADGLLVALRDLARRALLGRQPVAEVSRGSVQRRLQRPLPLDVAPGAAEARPASARCEARICRSQPAISASVRPRNWPSLRWASKRVSCTTSDGSSFARSAAGACIRASTSR